MSGWQPTPVTDLLLFERAIQLAEGVGCPANCERGPFCVRCLLGLAKVQLDSELDAPLDHAPLLRARNIAILRAPEHDPVWTRELALSTLRAALEDVK